MNGPDPIVLKLGGSLLTLPDLFERLHAVTMMLRNYHLLLIPGGGAAADVIRRLDAQFQLSPEKAHRAAIAAMSDNASMLARLGTFFSMVSTREDAVSVWASGRVAILDTFAFLQNEEQCDDASRLPPSWDVTSDSIAAWIATRWPASRLVLAKSCSMDGLSVAELIADRRLDAWFSRVSRPIPVFWLNLKHGPLTLLPLAGESGLS